MIEIVDVCKTFSDSVGSVDACKNVSLKINDGEIFGIIGYSGAGKSTLVRCMNLLETPDSGEVIVGGTPLTKLSAARLRAERRQIGMIFQHFNLMPSRTVRQNVEFPLLRGGLNRSGRRERAEKLLSLVGIPEKADAYPAQLSGGQKQRAAIARALANDPKVLLCDEATSALDPQSTRSVLQLLKKLNRTLGLTVVIITHEMSVIKDICDTVAVMEDGRIAETGSTFDIFSNPHSRIAKDFVRTASNVEKIDALVADNSPLLQSADGDRVVNLVYRSKSVSSPLISQASRQFNVNFNIIFGNVETIQDAPVGALAVTVVGAQGDVEAALEYFRQNGVSVEVLK